MQWKHHRVWIIAVLVITGALLAWFTLSTPSSVPHQDSVTASTTGTDLTGRAIYTSGEYGFIVSYPETARVEEVFSPQYHIGTVWRALAPTESVGTPILALIAYSTESDHSYPRYFIAQVRVGASTDQAAIKSCEISGANHGEKQLPDVLLNGTSWKAFAFESAGMMQYVKGVSYRTVHEGTCFSLEKIVSGSAYRDDPDSPDDVPDGELEARYASLDAIIDTFTFARP